MGATHCSQENPMNELDPIVTTNKKSFHLLEIVVAATSSQPCMEQSFHYYKLYSTVLTYSSIILWKSRMILNIWSIIAAYEGSNF